jgi:hypothetical protein
LVIAGHFGNGKVERIPNVQFNPEFATENSVITAIGARDNALTGDNVVISGFVVVST